MLMIVKTKCQFTKTEITNQKWKKEIWKMTNLHTTTTNITVPRSLAHPLVNFWLMSPKLVRTYPHIVENWGITMAPLILRLISWKVLPNQLKIHIFASVKTNQHVTSFLEQSAVQHSNFQCKQKQTKRPKHLWKTILIDWGGLFSFYQSQK